MKLCLAYRYGSVSNTNAKAFWLRQFNQQFQHLLIAILGSILNFSLSFQFFAAANVMDNDLLPSIAAVDDVYIASLVPGHNYNSNNGHGNGNHNLGNHHLHHNNVAQFENALDESEDSVDETTYPPPVFDFGMPRNITARTGHTAAINCRVENLRDKSVSQMEDAYLPEMFFLTYSWLDFMHF